MRKAWRIVSGLALMCMLLGIVGVAVGFFTGSSPVALQNHGNLVEYTQRLNMNWDILRNDAAALLATLGLR